MKKIIEIVNISIISIIIFLSTMLIGGPINTSNIFPVYIVIAVYAIIYALKKIICKEKSKLELIDIIIIIFGISIIISLIFQRYVSLSEEIYMIIKNISLLNIYLIVKQVCKKNPKMSKVIVNVIIFSILILCVIGLDEIKYNYLRKFKKIIGFTSIYYDEKRICSLFAYPNTMACIAGAGIFLCLGRIFEENKKRNKFIYLIIMCIMIVTFLKTYSRLAILILAGIMFVDFIVLAKKYKIASKINKKTIGIIITICIGIIIYIAVGMKISDEVIVKENYQKIFYNVNQNCDYEIEFELEQLEENQGTFKITQKNEYFDNEEVTTVSLKPNETNIKMNIHTSENTNTIYLNITTKEGTKIKINKCKINGQDIILKYKLLPTNIVDKLKSISIKNKSANERFTFMKDAINLIKDNWIFGYGGNAWRTLQWKSQSYRYYAKEVHSFILQIFLESGIIGVSALMGIYIYVIKKIIQEILQKEPNIYNINILMAVLFVLLHSLLDFNMSFVYAEFITFIIIATYLGNTGKKEFEIKFENILNCIVILSSIFVIYIAGVETYYINDSDIQKNMFSPENNSKYEMYCKLLPHNSSLKVMRMNKALRYKEDNSEELANILKDLLKNERYIENNINLGLMISMNKYFNDNEILDYIEETKMFKKYDPDYQILRFGNILKLMKDAEEQDKSDIVKQYKEKLLEEINEKEHFILDYKKSRYNKEATSEYERMLKKYKEELKEVT